MIDLARLETNCMNREDVEPEDPELRMALSHQVDSIYPAYGLSRKLDKANETLPQLLVLLSYK